VLCSEEIGYEKPDERAFAIALKHAQVNNPQNALHVGDDYQR
jgi:FMN phosphatase YigB (HAD superfamily)